jgi:hypothetical protein
MRALTGALALIALLSACGRPPLIAAPQPGGQGTQTQDASHAGGLAADEAIRPSVVFARPQAFALTEPSEPFLNALAEHVEPQRLALARQLVADPTVSSGLTNWERAGRAGQFRTLQRVAALQGDVMGCRVPTLVENGGEPDRPGLMAYFQPDQTGSGRIVTFPRSMAQGGKYLAVATLLHEMRHAAQFQLATSRSAVTRPGGAVLAPAYAAAWRAMGELGGEERLSYGDYCHLTIEYDAFQTGNQVATLISQGAYDGMGCGFVDMQYRGERALPALKLLPMMQKLTGTALAATVNKAQYKAVSSYNRKLLELRHPASTARILPQLVSAP